MYWKTGKVVDEDPKDDNLWVGKYTAPFEGLKVWDTITATAAG